MLLAQSSDGFPDCGRVMREVVVHPYPADFAFQLETPPDTAKSGECFDRDIRGNTCMTCGGDGGEAVQPVEFPGQRPLEAPNRPALLGNLEGTLAVRSAHLPSGRNPELLRWRPASLSEDTLQRSIPSIYH